MTFQSRQFQTLVVGSGPAGIAAAVRAAEQGVSVGLVDDNRSPGGQIWRSADSTTPHGREETEWRRRLLSASVTLLQGWTVFDQRQRAPATLRAERQGEAANFRYEKLVLATGARERFLPFPGWTLPNVMGVGAIQADAQRRPEGRRSAHRRRRKRAATACGRSELSRPPAPSLSRYANRRPSRSSCLSHLDWHPLQARSPRASATRPRPGACRSTPRPGRSRLAAVPDCAPSWFQLEARSGRSLAITSPAAFTSSPTWSCQSC